MCFPKPLQPIPCLQLAYKRFSDFSTKFNCTVIPMGWCHFLNNQSSQEPAANYRNQIWKKLIFSQTTCISLPSTKDLHAEKSENEDEEDKQDEQGHDGGDGVDKGLDQVAHGLPVPAIGRELRRVGVVIANH